VSSGFFGLQNIVVHNYVEKPHKQPKIHHNQHGKAPPHPLLLPNKPQKTMQLQNRTQKITRKNTCTQKAPTTTTKRNPNSNKANLLNLSPHSTTTNMKKLKFRQQQQPNKPKTTTQTRNKP